MAPSATGSFTPWRYVPRPPGNLWPSDGLEQLDLDDATGNLEVISPRPAEHKLVQFLSSLTDI